MRIPKGVYEYFLVNSCINLSSELVSQIIYENAANTRIFNSTLLWIKYSDLGSITLKK